MRGYAAIGLHQAKHSVNVGGVLRAAGCYGAAMVATTGRRYRNAGTDTMKSVRHLPLLQVADLWPSTARASGASTRTASASTFPILVSAIFTPGPVAAAYWWRALANTLGVFGDGSTGLLGVVRAARGVDEQRAKLKGDVDRSAGHVSCVDYGRDS